MHQFFRAVVLETGLLVALTAGNAPAAPIVRNIAPLPLSAGEFNGDFIPETGVMASDYTLLNTPTTGVVESQVFKGIGPYAGLTAYAYQIDVNNVSDNSGGPASVNSASLAFGATPAPLLYDPTSTSVSAVYTVTAGQVGGISAPEAAAGSTVQGPTSVAWQPGTTTGPLTFQFLDAASNTGPLQAGATSATIIVMTASLAPTTTFMSLQNQNPEFGDPEVYTPSANAITEIFVPEPTAAMGWLSGLAALAVIGRSRRKRRD